MSALCRYWTAWRANFDGRRRFGVARAMRMADTGRAAQTIPGEGVATMTASWVRTAAAAASVLALQACAMPHSEYPPSEGYQTPAALDVPKPQYPVTQDQPPPVRSADPHDPVASPTAPVTSQPLPPPASSSGPTAYFGPRLTYAVAWAAPVELWQAARHRYRYAHVHMRSHTHVDARGRLEAGFEAKTVRVRKGDTLRSLARRYGTTPRALMGANGIRRQGDLAVGEPIVVPGAPAAPTPRGRRAEAAEMRETEVARTYRAHAGDTIYAIGRRFRVSPETIEALNGFTQRTRLTRGQLVRLPGSRAEVAAERAWPRAPRPAFIPPSNEAERTMAEPDHPIPYAELQDQLEGPTARYAPIPSVATPPERPIAPPVAQPQPLGPPDASVLLAGRGRFVWPVRGTVFSGFGPKAGGQRSDGVDIAAALGTPVMAAATGDVVYAGALPELGNLVLIKHQDGWITAYAHLSRTEVRIRDHVTQGQEVGQAGQSGSAAQSEVYFEIRYAPTPRDKARPIDPALLLASQ
jgi:murein DD-endopeptidase MepM/ murein hydrolase activator NlpD